VVFFARQRKMYLADAILRLQTIRVLQSAPGTIDAIFEIHDNYGKDESGNVPVFVIPDPVKKKERRALS